MLSIKRLFFSTGIFCVIALFWVTFVGGDRTTPVNTIPKTDFVDMQGYEWALDAVSELVDKGIISGVTPTEFNPTGEVTREQLAKMLTIAFGLKDKKDNPYNDVEKDRWSYSYISSACGFMYIEGDRFQPTKSVSREEAAAAIVNCARLEITENARILDAEFADGMLVAPSIKKEVATAYENKLIDGIDGKLQPIMPIRRCDATLMIYRGILLQSKKLTPILGEAQVDYKVAQQWAKNRNAADIFIDAAPIYWKYGKITGIRPEVLYCQAAKETNYGKYTGQVTPDMNNWAGIKTINATGDKPEDHERFLTPDDGIRAHFNHMCAYVGIVPVGQPHDRYKAVLSRSFAGSVKYVEHLGGKWAPAQDYGESIVNDYLNKLLAT
ncbi:MAG: S-layer homology domain-containing protein [Eubacteriales bacterium]|nr:S-layer homology domain-containing protein [Eubacteriales bacterium]